MNADGIPMGEYLSSAGDMIQRLCVAFMTEFVIDANILVIL